MKAYKETKRIYHLNNEFDEAGTYTLTIHQSGNYYIEMFGGGGGSASHIYTPAGSGPDSWQSPPDTGWPSHTPHPRGLCRIRSIQTAQNSAAYTCLLSFSKDPHDADFPAGKTPVRQAFFHEEHLLYHSAYQ